MLGGNTARLDLARRVLTLLVIAGMTFGSYALTGAQMANAVIDTTTFEVGSLEPGPDTLAGLIQGSYDWDDLTVHTGGSFDPGDVVVINDTGYTGPHAVIDPATATTVDANCPNINDDDIIAGGTEIDDYPFEVVDGSVPGKVDLCQVYLSYGVNSNGDTILYVGALRREINGTVAVAIELNSISHAQRQPGDVLVTFEFDGNGPISELNVRRWTGSQWQLVDNVEHDGGSWEHFGEVWVNLTDTDLLPPPTSADDCSSFSSILPYGFRGNSDNSQVGDWATPAEVQIPRCGQLQIVKQATPDSGDLDFGWRLEDNGGIFDDLTGTIQDGETISLDLVDGEYSLTEDVIPDPYDLDTIECSGDNDPGAITVETGQLVTCTIFNTAPSLTLIKEVAPQYGGSASDTDWTLTADGPTPISGSEGDPSVTGAPVVAGSYDLSESGGPQGWEQSGDWSCGAATMTDGDTVVVGPGQDVTCEVTNTDVPPILTLVKDVQNTYGGNADTDDFTLTATGPVTISGTTGQPAVTSAQVLVGSYDLDETGPPGYTQVGSWSCIGGAQTDGDTIMLAPGDVATCTVTNQDTEPGLTVVKVVENDFGGTAVAGDFQLRVNGSAVEQGESLAGIVANTEYTITEDQLDGYEQVGDVMCVDDDTQVAVAHPVTLDEGQAVTCTITNQDLAPELIVVKDLTNDDGGNAEVGDFSLYVNGVPATSGQTHPGVLSNTEYTITEDQLPGYFQVGDVVCVDNQTQEDVGHPVTLDPGQSVTCTIANDDQPPGLIVVKEVQNDFGGDAVPADFQLYLNGQAVQQGVPLDVSANTVYTVTEDDVSGYTLVGVSCADGDGDVGHPVTLDPGQSVICTVVNQDVAPQLTLVKDVINDNGGGTGAPGFQLTLNGVATNQGLQTGILANTEYTLGEVPVVGYLQVGDVVCVDDDTQQAVAHPVTLAEGQAVTCTITNDDIAPGLIVVKEVINDNGGTASASDFQLRIDGMAVVQGQAVGVSANSPHLVTEDPVAGYSLTSISCVRSGTDENVGYPAILAEGDSVTCTVTNDDIAPQLTVVKAVINDDAGAATAADFQLLVNGVEVAQGVALQVDANVSYTVGEPMVQGYLQVGQAVCVDNRTQEDVGHPVTLQPGQAVTCTVTNDDIPDEVLAVEILPFTGWDADETLALGIVLLLSGLLAVLTSRKRGRHETPKGFGR